MKYDKLEQIERVAAVYEKHGTLQGTANEMGLSKERIRQILISGADEGVITYTPIRKRRTTKLNKLTKEFPRSSLIRALIKNNNAADALKELGLSPTNGKTLMKMYNITREDYAIEKFQKKYLKQYRSLVEVLGYHPSTTEMQNSNNHKVLYDAITRYWGSIDTFRQQYGIEKQGYFVNPEAKKRWLDAMKKTQAKRGFKKAEKKARVLAIINDKKYVSQSLLSKVTKINPSTLFIYLTELEQEEKIIKTQIKNRKYYISRN